ncbi:MAG: FeoB-associated Cys-rich membrane protein [Clostridia bacterium]|nr:FeoB-associated Cys-rich membrane protein [Clostridia bacterium]
MWPTIIIATVVAVVFIAIVVKGIINKKNGKSSCSCGSGCGSCSLKGTCHANTEKNEKQ